MNPVKRASLLVLLCTTTFTQALFAANAPEQTVLAYNQAITDENLDAMNQQVAAGVFASRAIRRSVLC